MERQAGGREKKMARQEKKREGDGRQTGWRRKEGKG